MTQPLEPDSPQQERRQGPWAPSPQGGESTYGFPRRLPQNPGGHDEALDPDYHLWRSEQLRVLDEDYRLWRQDRHPPFAQDFERWRRSRSGHGGG